MFTQTSIWRFTLVFITIAMMVCGATLVVVYQYTVAEQNRQLEQRLLFAASGLNDVADSKSNPSAFQKTILNRTEESQSLILALQSPETKKVFGNLDALPRGIPTYPEFSPFPIAIRNYRNEPELTFALGTLLETPHGMLLVGLFNENQDLADRFFTISAFALGAALCITLIAGIVFNWRVLLKVKQMGTFVEQIQSGKLQTRLPVSHRKDEYDVIADHINHMLDEIDELMSSISGVTDNVAHDLRTPISRIRIRLEQSLEHPNLPEAIKHLNEALLEELDHLIATFNAMLELSRLEKGRLTTSNTECDLGKLCEDAVELIQPLAQEKLNLKLTILRSGRVNADPNLLFRAIYNVIENAVLYTGNEGDVQVHLNGTTVTVEDNGPGIPEYEHEKVFRRLARLDNSRKSEGFGMGLPIVKAIMQRYGGSVSLESLQQGLRVILKFQ